MDPTGIFSFNNNPAGVHSQSTQNSGQNIIITVFFPNIYLIFGSQARLSLLLEYINRKCVAVYLSPLLPLIQLLAQVRCIMTTSLNFPSQLFPRNNFALLTMLDACNPTPFKRFAMIFSNQTECIPRIIFPAKIVRQFWDILTLQLTGNFSNLRNLGRTCVHACVLCTP